MASGFLPISLAVVKSKLINAMSDNELIFGRFYDLTASVVVVCVLPDCWVGCSGTANSLGRKLAN